LVEGDEKSGRPKSTRTEVSIAGVTDLFKNGRRILSRMIAESLNIPKTTVLRILKEDLGKRKLCACFVQQSFTTEQRDDRVTSFEDIFAMADADKKSFNKIIKGGETWCFTNYPETKRQSSEWVGETSPQPKKTEIPKVRIKTKLIIFFDSQGVVHKEFVPDGKKVNTEFHKGLMDRLLKLIQRVGPAAFCSRDFSCCTKMRPPTKLHVFVTTLYHPPYYSDLSPPDYFLFPKLKMKLKGLHFVDVAEI
jgi:hypothetical protein